MSNTATPTPTSPAGRDPRFAGLDEPASAALHAAARAIRDGACDTALAHVAAVLAQFPGHAEARRLQGIAHTRAGRPARAIELLAALLADAPDDVMVMSDLAVAHRAAGDTEAALSLWRRACQASPDALMPCFNLGRNLQALGHTDEAIDVLSHACALGPDLVPAHVLLGDALLHRGRLDDAQAHYRRAIALQPSCGDAWRGLSNIKTHPLSADDRAALQAQVARDDIPPADRIAMGFALGKALDDAGEFATAFIAFKAANAQQQRMARWNADAFMQHLMAMLSSTPAARPGTRGEEVVFIVGLPRSGSTLIEQVLAAHPQVEGASELPELEQVLEAESRRRGRALPHWLRDATPADWQRLGEEYLARTARWRATRPKHTDKMPENWLYTGLLRAMLPGARVIDVRRDAVETGLSCFKQHFYRQPHFANDLADIAAYTFAHDQAMDRWQRERPHQVRVQRYEALQREPEAEIRALLAFCGLPFDPACLRFHEAERSVRTASAAQVRQPLRGDTARAASYGAMLAPLLTTLQQLGML